MLRKFLIVFLLVNSFTSFVMAEETEEASFTLPQKGVSSLTLFKALPVLEEGRIKPLDTYAENLLLRFSGRRSFNKKPAIHWLAKHFFMPKTTVNDEVFLINHPDILSALGIEKKKRRRYSYEDIKDGQDKLFELSLAASDVDEKERSIVENELIRLFNNIDRYLKLTYTFQFAFPSESFRVLYDQTREKLKLPIERNLFSFLEIALRADPMESVLKSHGQIAPEAWGNFEKEIMRILSMLYQWSTFYRDLPFTNIPSINSDEETWQSPWDAIANQFTEETIQKEIILLADMALAYREGDQLLFDLNGKRFFDSIKDRGGEKFRRASRYLDREIFYNQLRPFLWTKLIYFIVFLLLIGHLLNRKSNYLFLGKWLLIAGFALHVFALGLRITIVGRPPVTSLYETFIFVSVISVLLGLIMEKLNKKGLGILVASISGFLLLLIAGKYSAEGDTFKVLIAVLNTNFWLTVHVPTITAGYAACCVAGVLGHVYILQAIFKPKSKALLASTYRNMIGILGLGLTLTFFGTCLGGIWADQSWGRFWGWDPKENGALMIVLWTILIFHARIAGLIKPLGVAVCSVLGLIVVMWAWFGVNLLSVGLHSYGFTSGIALSLIIFAMAETLFCLIGGNLADRKLKQF